jgi:hypothetical protein
MSETECDLMRKRVQHVSIPARAIWFSDLDLLPTEQAGTQVSEHFRILMSTNQESELLKYLLKNLI